MDVCIIDAIIQTSMNGATENAGPENDGLELDGPEQRAVMSLVQDHMRTLKTIPISLSRHTYFETVIFLP